MRAAVTGFALWVVTFLSQAAWFAGGYTTLQRLIIFVVAVIFGLANAPSSPSCRSWSIPLYTYSLVFPCSC